MTGGSNGWRLTREKILMWAGLLLIFIVLLLTALAKLDKVIAGQFLLAGLALCGISITQWGDRKNGG